MTVACLELGEFEGEILVQAVDQCPLRRTEPPALLAQEVGDVSVAEFTDERCSWKFSQSFTVGDGCPEPIRILVFRDERISSCGCQQDQDEIPLRSLEQQVFFEPAILPKSHAARCPSSRRRRAVTW